MSEDVLEPVKEVLMSGYVGQGPKVDEFEEILADYLGIPHVNLLNSATSGLHLALHLLNEGGERDEILVTPLTCLATTMPIVQEGLKIKWVDLDTNTCNLDLTDLRRKIGPKTLAIMVVHWGGYPVDLDELKDIQDQCQSLYGFKPLVIEDCAHALGATFNDKLIGSHGNFCVFSFQAIKHVTMCDGGLLVCPTDQFHRRAKLLRWYGLDRTSSLDFRCSQNVEDWGYKYQPNDLGAVIGIGNFRHLSKILEKHRENAMYFYQQLNISEDLQLLELRDECNSSYWIFTILVKRRDDFMRKMKECGIGVSRVHDRNDKHVCFEEFRIPLPTTDYVCDRIACIPCGWWVTKEDREYIVEKINEGW